MNNLVERIKRAILDNAYPIKCGLNNHTEGMAVSSILHWIDEEYAKEPQESSCVKDLCENLELIKLHFGEEENQVVADEIIDTTIEALKELDAKYRIESNESDSDIISRKKLVEDFIEKNLHGNTCSQSGTLELINKQPQVTQTAKTLEENDLPECEWRFNQFKSIYNTGCGDEFDMHCMRIANRESFSYCPHCGKKLKVVK